MTNLNDQEPIETAELLYGNRIRNRHALNEDINILKQEILEMKQLLKDLVSKL